MKARMAGLTLLLADRDRDCRFLDTASLAFSFRVN